MRRDRPRVLLTGASSFLGSHLLGALLARPCLVRALVHRKTVAGGPRIEQVKGDLAEPATIARLCDGVDLVLHAATRVSEEEAECQAVNARGSEALVGHARRAGVSRVVYLSNAAVYGDASHRDVREEEAVVAPVTPIGRSRIAAEDAVLAAGGIVLRPLFVYGHGDLRFIPTVLRAVRRFPFLVDGGRARLSVIAARDLARAACDLLLSRDVEPGVYHATDGQPTSYRELVELLSSLFGTPRPWLSLPYGLARMLIGLGQPGLLGSHRGSASARHRLFLISRDHSYDSARLWSAIGRPPGPPLAVQLFEHADWYRPFAQGGQRQAW